MMFWQTRVLIKHDLDNELTDNDGEDDEIGDKSVNQLFSFATGSPSSGNDR